MPIIYGNSGDDVTEFKLKRKPMHAHDHKTDKKNSKSLLDKTRKNEFKSARQKTNTDDIIVIKEENSPHTLAGHNAQNRFKVPEVNKHLLYSLNISVFFQNIAEQSAEIDEVSSNISIPDAKAVFEARKKREMLRKGGEAGEVIPLDDTVRLKEKGHQSRLVLYLNS
jgi:hypothetical protein